MPNKCGRDFLYFALHFYHPTVFNVEKLNPLSIDKHNLLGVPVTPWLAWTQLQFWKAAKFLAKYDLVLSINGRTVRGYSSFVYAILFSRNSLDEALLRVCAAVDEGEVAGIDISLGLYGLLDHVLFVYGYDNDNLYVFDTHTVTDLEYVQTDTHPHLYVLPKEVVKKRWTRFGRVWVVSRGYISAR